MILHYSENNFAGHELKKDLYFFNKCRIVNCQTILLKKSN